MSKQIPFALFHIHYSLSKWLSDTIEYEKYVVLHLVEALGYKPEGYLFDFRWGL
jgi:hypothetical protein